jgi:DNA invertase Pin-like site-specific DNA recombinase
MNGQKIGYKRVSTIDQNTARQLDGVPLDKLFEDKASGKTPTDQSFRQHSATVAKATRLSFTRWIDWHAASLILEGW